MEESVKDSVMEEKQQDASSLPAHLPGKLPSSSTTQEENVVLPREKAFVPEQPAHSYAPYSWKLLNRILDIVDEKTHGRAGWLQRMVSYLFFGGLAAVTNLIVLYLMYYHALSFLGKDFALRNTLSYIVAAEVSLLANFIPNDRFTFHALPGAKRPWIQRCLRFHLTAIVGSVLTYLIEFGLSSLTPIEPVRAEAIATIIVLIYNFSFHHIYTYRRIRGKKAEVAA